MKWDILILPPSSFILHPSAFILHNRSPLSSVAKGGRPRSNSLASASKDFVGLGGVNVPPQEEDKWPPPR